MAQTLKCIWWHSPCRKPIHAENLCHMHWLQKCIDDLKDKLSQSEQETSRRIDALERKIYDLEK